MSFHIPDLKSIYDINIPRLLVMPTLGAPALLPAPDSSHRRKRRPNPDLEPFVYIPTERQDALERNRFYGFFHFGMNTFTGTRMGWSDTSPSVFTPSSVLSRGGYRSCRHEGRYSRSETPRQFCLSYRHHRLQCISGW